MKVPLSVVVLVWAMGTAGAVTAENIVVHSNGTTETRGGKTWTRLTSVVEVTTDVPLAQVLSVVTDWASYPRLFSRVKAVSAVPDGPDVLLTQTTVVNVLGFAVTNRFTLRVTTSVDPVTGAVAVHWTQEKTDGTIDGLEGGWDLVPVTGERPGTRIQYRNNSSIPQTFFGEDGVVSLFLPGEMKQVVARVLTEARQKKETP